MQRMNAGERGRIIPTISNNNIGHRDGATNTMMCWMMMATIRNA